VAAIAAVSLFFAAVAAIASVAAARAGLAAVEQSRVMNDEEHLRQVGAALIGVLQAASEIAPWIKIPDLRVLPAGQSPSFDNLKRALLDLRRGQFHSGDPRL
jgi:hypothetical protein